MKKLFLTLLATLLVSSIWAQTYVSAGQEIYGNWRKSGSPYIIKGQVTIPSNKTLTIEKGTTIKLHNAGRIVVNGTMVAIGEKDQMIVFTQNGSEKWKQIYFNNSTNNMLRFCRFEYGYNQKGYGVVTLENASADISHCVFAKNGSVGIHLINSPQHTIRHCTFVANENTDFYCPDQTKPKLINCLFWQGSRPVDNYPVYIKNCAFSHATIGRKEIDSGGNLFSISNPFAEEKNYTLKANSVCVGAGENGADIGAMPYRNNVAGNNNSYNNSYNNSSNNNSGNNSSNNSHSAHSDGPKITINYPEISGSSAPIEYSSEVTIMGFASHNDGVFTVFINDQPADLDDYGNFSLTVGLEYGDNTFKIKASDRNNNSTTINLKITRKQ